MLLRLLKNGHFLIKVTKKRKDKIDVKRITFVGIIEFIFYFTKKIFFTLRTYDQYYNINRFSLNNCVFTVNVL